MIQIYADGTLTYDSRLDDYGLAGLQVTTALNKGGTASIIMPPGHPAYDLYTSYKTVVEIYRDGSLQFRGRVLYPADDFYNRRTIVCEGELCFFQDAVARPYLYQTDPATIFGNLIAEYNAQVQPDKQFKVGTVTVVDDNDYVRLESESAAPLSEALDKLLERCGGYIVFTTDPSDNKRTVNWYASLGYHSGQAIEFGGNLLNFARSGANTELATVIIPYGAKDEETGTVLTIESVNNGLDYIEDTAAIALRGRITKAVFWDDVTTAANLLSKAQQYLAQSRYIITTLELSALDLSYLDKSIDSYQVGDTIRVRSKPHQVDEDFQLTERTEDYLNPGNSKIVLGKDIRTLTDADVAGDNNSLSELHREVRRVKSDYTIDISAAVQESERTLTTLIQQTSETIRFEVENAYTTNDELTERLATVFTQFEDQFLFEFEKLEETVTENDTEARQKLNEIYSYISFEGGNIVLGASGNSITLTLENDMIVFKNNGARFGWWDGTDFHTGNIVVETNERAQFGNFAFIPRSNGSLSFLKVGG